LTGGDSGPHPAVVAAEERARALEFKISCNECAGRLLAVLAAGVPASGRVLEIGSGVGMGTAWVVSGLGERTDVEVVTVERDPRLFEAVQLWRWPRFVRLLHADVLEVLGSLGSFELVFADSYSGKYQGLDRTIASLRPGGLLLVDDMAPRPNASERDRLEQADLLRTLLGHEWLQAVHMAWCSGVVLAARRSTA
jgi:predicted O-methyltransferase YrrM